MSASRASPASLSASSPAAPARLRVDDVRRLFGVRSSMFGRATGLVYAVDGVSFELAAGETLAIVGESGCGKTTIARMIVRLETPTSGHILLNGDDISLKENLPKLRRSVQLIGQNPFAALNRRKSILHALIQPLDVHGLARTWPEKVARAQELLRQVGLSDKYLSRYPASVSGGELQRITIARSLAVEPTVLILDEPTASLDVSVKALLIELLVDLQASLGLSYLLITHEIDIARHISDRIAVMYLGKIVETGPTEELVANPRHPYTASLLASVPVPDPSRRSEFRPLYGEVPSALSRPPGCAFHARCAYAQQERCPDEAPILRTLASRHEVACHFAEDIARGAITPVETVDG